MQNDQPQQPVLTMDDDFLLDKSVHTQTLEQLPKKTGFQHFATVAIILIGCYLLFISSYDILQLRESSTPGPLFALNCIQIALALGLIFLKNPVRVLIIVIMLLNIAENLYVGFFVGLSAVFVHANELPLWFVVLSNAIKLIIPVAAIILLNIKSVKAIFR